MGPSNAARQRAEPHELHLKLLGGFALAQSGHVIHLPHSVQRMVAFLSLRDRPLERSHVAGSLWPDGTQAQCFASLRSTLWRLRRTGLDVVRVTQNDIVLADHVAIDVRDVAAQVRRLTDTSVPCQPSDLDPAPLCDELLPGWLDDDWLVVERERMRQMCLHGLEALCDRLRDSGRYGLAIEAGLAAVRGESLRESAHRALIKVHLAEGNHWEALRQYRWYRTHLQDELGLAPSPLLLGLVEGLMPPLLASMILPLVGVA